MNLEMIGKLIGLRYKLMWAKTRSRNGKIALFVTGYFLLVLFMALMGAGGLGAGIAAVHSGKGQSVAQLVLLGLFAQALISTVVLGFGLNAVFSETELRRYPLTSRERWLARHCIGILDPFWFLILVLDLGLLIGMYLVGNVSFGLGLAGVALLFVCNYLTARVVAVATEHAMKGRAGPLVVMLIVVLLSLLPGTLAPILHKNHALVEQILAVLRFTPPFAAAAAIAGDLASAWYGLATEAWWTLGLLAALVALEKRQPARPRAAVSGKIRWDNRWERIAGVFGPREAPQVAFWLRFYARNNRFRTLCLLTLPLCAFLVYNMGRMEGHRLHGQNGMFIAALGVFPLASFIGVSRIAVNQFGYAAGAFRRVLLFPTAPAASLRACSYAGLLVSVAMLLVTTIAWMALAPVAWDARMLFMLLASGAMAMFLFHAAALWVTIYFPRRGKYDASFGNDMSAAANILVVGGTLACIFAPQVVSGAAPMLVDPANWWIPVPAVAAAMALYNLSLRLASARFVGRREQLMAVVEGRS